MKPLIAIPTYNEERHIRSVLEAVLADSGARQSLIVVVDGGSTDNTLKIVRAMAQDHAQIRILANPKRIQSAGVNLAVETYGADFDVLVRLDAHAHYPMNYISGLMSSAASTGAQSVVVTMRAVGESCFQLATATAQNSRLGTGGAAHRMGSKSTWVDHGHHALMDLKSFRLVGGYDTTLATNEDADLDTRLTQSGARIWLSVEQQIEYFPRRTPQTLWRQYFKFGFGRATTLRRHGKMPRLRQMIPMFIAPMVALAGFAPLHPVFLAPGLAWAGGCLIYGAALGFRRKSLCSAASGLPAMIMHLSWSMGFWFNRLGGQL